MTDSPLPALRALYPEVDKAIRSAEDRARRAQEKHDGMVAANRELQEELERTKARLPENFLGDPQVLTVLAEIKDVVEASWKDSVESLVEAVDDIGKAQKAVEEANYWLNKVRTDEDHDDATSQMEAAQEQLDTAIAKALGLARQYVPIPTEDLFHEVEKPTTMRGANGMGPDCEFGHCRVCGHWHDRVMVFHEPFKPDPVIQKKAQEIVQKVLREKTDG